MSCWYYGIIDISKWNEDFVYTVPLRFVQMDYWTQTREQYALDRKHWFTACSLGVKYQNTKTAC